MLVEPIAQSVTLGLPEYLGVGPYESLVVGPAPSDSASHVAWLSNGKVRVGVRAVADIYKIIPGSDPHSLIADVAKSAGLMFYDPLSGYAGSVASVEHMITQISIDWGDGYSDSFTAPYPLTQQHDYSVAGTYEIATSLTFSDVVNPGDAPTPTLQPGMVLTSRETLTVT